MGHLRKPSVLKSPVKTTGRPDARWMFTSSKAWASWSGVSAAGSADASSRCVVTKRKRRPDASTSTEAQPCASGNGKSGGPRMNWNVPRCGFEIATLALRARARIALRSWRETIVDSPARRRPAGRRPSCRRTRRPRRPGRPRAAPRRRILEVVEPLDDVRPRRRPGRSARPPGLRRDRGRRAGSGTRCRGPLVEVRRVDLPPGLGRRLRDERRVAGERRRDHRSVVEAVEEVPRHHLDGLRPVRRGGRGTRETQRRHRGGEVNEGACGSSWGFCLSVR